jgi:nucleoside-diphosphate-sugar epimerase
MKILITDSSGFIGFNSALKLLKKKNINKVGIDNYDNYYSVKQKKEIKYLKKI